MVKKAMPDPESHERSSPALLKNMRENDRMELGAIVDALYESEINCSVITFWDGGFTVQLGDEMNSFVAEHYCRTSLDAARFLDRAAREHFPDSEYALGKEEWERRNKGRTDRHRKN